MPDYLKLTLNSMSNYLKNALLNIYLKQSTATFTLPWLALYETPLTPDDTGTEISVWYGVNYARQSLYFYYNENTAFQYSAVSFPAAASEWGDIYSVGIRDASTGGNLLFYSNFAIPVNIQQGLTFRIAADNLQVSLGHPYGAKGYGGWGNAPIVSHTLATILSGIPIYYFLSGIQIALGRYLTVDTNYNMTGWTEVTASDYSRYSTTDPNLWATPSSGATYNTQDIVFTNGASEDWGDVSYIVIYTIADGYPALWGILDYTRTVKKGDGFKIPAGSLQVTFPTPT